VGRSFHRLLLSGVESTRVIRQRADESHHTYSIGHARIWTSTRDPSFRGVQRLTPIAKSWFASPPMMSLIVSCVTPTPFGPNRASASLAMAPDLAPFPSTISTPIMR
jgi:hypothetical protein